MSNLKPFRGLLLCLSIAAYQPYRSTTVSVSILVRTAVRTYTLSTCYLLLYTYLMPPQFSLGRNASQGDDNRITYFALTDSRNQRTPFGIKREDRSRHTYVIGKTGMGKSTLLENMAVQDIQNGEGLCFIDPHGSTAEKLLEYIPEHRVRDVLYFAPFDMQYPVSFNVLEDVGPDKRHFVVAGLMSTFEKIWVDAWSARMAYILQNTLAALLEFPGATLLGVNRMYIDKEYRKNVVSCITDPSVRSFWLDEYTKYTDRYTQEATPAIQNKIGQFAANALVRNIIGQSQSTFDIRSIMDQGKIFIVNLSKGRVGEGNANLLGSMLITKIYLAAMSRADASAAELRQLPPFFLHVDEFQNFANKSFADILSEARKYKLALTIAHQYVEQMEEEVASAVFGNVGTMMTFRVGAYDAETLEKEFAPTFMAEDLVNLGARQVYLKLMIDGVTSQPFSAVTMPPIPLPEVSNRDRAVAMSRAQFSRPRAEVEKDIADWMAKRYEDPEAEEKERARLERRATRDAEAGPAPLGGSARPFTPSAPFARPAGGQAGAPRPMQGAPRATGAFAGAQRPAGSQGARPSPVAPQGTRPPSTPSGAPRAPHAPYDGSRAGEMPPHRQAVPHDSLGERAQRERPHPRTTHAPRPHREEGRGDAVAHPGARGATIHHEHTDRHPVQTPDSLRAVLQRIATESAQKGSEEKAAPHAAVTAHPPQAVRVKADDGKGASAEDKASLKDMLSRLTAQQAPARSSGDAARIAEQRQSPAPLPPLSPHEKAASPQPMHRQPREDARAEQAAPSQQRASAAPPRPPAPNRVREIPEAELRKLLATDTPPPRR